MRVRLRNPERTTAHLRDGDTEPECAFCRQRQRITKALQPPQGESA
jgi:hypothetical protein